MEQRIKTLHPQGKRGVNISGDKYHLVRIHLILALEEFGELAAAGLRQAVEAQLAGRFDGSIPWYVSWVTLDLEARGEVERISGVVPQRYRLAGWLPGVPPA